MEENTPSTVQDTELNESLCVNCQVNPFEAGHPINLCTSCRTTLINYPIPKWIKVFAVCLGAVIVISIIRTQFYISAAIDLGKSEKAIENKEYLTAKRELEKVLKKFPNDIRANAEMIIASAYSFDRVAAGAAFDKIVDKQINDDDLYNEVETAIKFLSNLSVKDTVMMKKVDEVSKSKEGLLKVYQELKTTGNADNQLKFGVANYLYDLNEYAESEKVAKDVLANEPTNYPALGLLSAIKRETGQYDQAIKYCDEMLAINKQDIFAITQKARVELKRKHDSQAAIHATAAMQLDPQSDSALEAMAMVDYFAGRKKESLARLAIIGAHSAQTGDSTIFNRLTPIINGSTIYR
ncbi:hypothetical protein VRU48_17995 [Pedobacter sp. KR3-3]|uniref:Tetratricopeptide repeat protein n=1 Tax=Pedobacter albus TaxID=3113905 RepID=A0ABU7IC28_9SPHI|nr:hypothetical protein [Pedobacter sp. KR3-3]MEE1947022.1 hypothetical protein [Pedobacter sp. KR3-3]